MLGYLSFNGCVELDHVLICCKQIYINSIIFSQSINSFQFFLAKILFWRFCVLYGLGDLCANAIRCSAS